MSANTAVKGTAMPEYLETTADKFTFRVATDRLYTAEGRMGFAGAGAASGSASASRITCSSATGTWPLPM